jgi:uncharacterized membrane protein
MEPKRSKYDTNPLDERIADRANESLGSTRPGPPTEEVRGGPTRDIGRTENDAARWNPEAEAPTRRIDDEVTSYPSIFVPPKPRQPQFYEPPKVQAAHVANIYQPPPVPPPSVYQPPPVPIAFKPGSNTVAGLNIPERWAKLLPYIPGYIGAIAAVVELLLVPRKEVNTRFHAAQGLALQMTILVISGAFTFLTLISGSGFGAGVFRFAAFVFLIVSMIRAFKGKPHHIAPLDAPRKWLEEKIKPKQ